MNVSFPQDYLRILNTGRPLTEINPGSSEVALTRDAALAAVEALGDTQIGILGGDVLVDDKGRLRYTYANWHSDPGEGETPAQFARRSQRETAKYIRRYPSRRGPEPLFVLVCTVPARVRHEGPADAP